jgi:hypothetical protein
MVAATAPMKARRQKSDARDSMAGKYKEQYSAKRGRVRCFSDHPGQYSACKRNH